MIDDILDMAAKLKAARIALTACASQYANPDTIKAISQNALDKIWPTHAPARQIEVGGNYFDKNGKPWRCIAVGDGVAYMTLGGMAAAYTWTLDGKSAFADRGYDIDWARS